MHKFILTKVLASITLALLIVFILMIATAVAASKHILSSIVLAVLAIIGIYFQEKALDRLY